MDAVLRVTIGFIAGAVVMALIKAHVVNFDFGGVARDAHDTISVLIIGFIAGFSERLVPDLLEKASFKPTDAAAAPVAPTTRRTDRTAATPDLDANAATARGNAPPPPPPPDDPDPLPAEAAEDGCVADIDLDDDEVAADSDLPPASGGVEKPDEGGAR